MEFNYSRPKDDLRAESCRVHEESIKVAGKVKRESEKSALIERALISSEKEAMARQQSLAVIRPEDVRLSSKRLEPEELESDRKKFALQARQLSLLEAEIATYEPCPFRFTMHYKDGDGPHDKTCADWETSATFFNLRRQMSEQDVLRHLERTYCEEYVKKGLVFALGNMKKRPQTWQLLGIFPVVRSEQPDLFN